MSPFYGIHICSFSRGVYTLTLPSGESFRFDWSDRFGPQFLGKHDREVKGPGSRHRFWKAIEWWCKQGHRLNGDQCVYDIPVNQPQAFLCLGRQMVLDTDATRKLVGEDVVEAADKRVLIEDVWTGKLVTFHGPNPDANLSKLDD